MSVSEEVRFRVRRNGAEFAEIYPYGNSVPTMRADSGSQIKMSLRGTFLAQGKDADGRNVEIDWMNDEIKPVLITDGEEKSLGVLLVSTVETNTEGQLVTVDIEAYDRTWRVRDSRKTTQPYYSAGTPYLDVIESLLVESGIELVSRTETDSVLTEDREDWEVGTSNLEIVNALLKEINYSDVWFDALGAAILMPKIRPVAENVQHVFTEKKPDPRNQKEIGIISIQPQIARSTDVYDVPNVYICICSNADKAEAMKAVAENTNPESPFSIMRRGRRIVKVEKLQNIASQAALQAYANQKVTESMMTVEQVQVKTQLQAGFGIRDVIALQTENNVGIYTENGWTMELCPGGIMTHELEKVVYSIG